MHTHTQIYAHKQSNYIASSRPLARREPPPEGEAPLGGGRGSRGGGRGGRQRLVGSTGDGARGTELICAGAPRRAGGGAAECQSALRPETLCFSASALCISESESLPRLLRPACGKRPRRCLARATSSAIVSRVPPPWQRRRREALVPPHGNSAARLWRPQTNRQRELMPIGAGVSQQEERGGGDDPPPALPRWCRV